MSYSTYTSGQISFSGLGNGTDFDTLIEGLMDVERKRVTRLENWRATWDLKNEYFQDLNTKMLELKSTLEGLDTMNEFMTKAVNSSNTSMLVATANSEAQESSHTIEIGQLATNDVLISTSGASSLKTSIASSATSFTFSYAGQSHTIANIAAGTTLEGFVNIINNHSESRGKIVASTIFDGTSYHLQLTGADQGADNQIIISNAGSLMFGPGDFTETQNAQNSQIRVNGFPASNAGWIERSSNVMDDVITGLTLNLKNADPGREISLTVTTDEDGIVENVTKFVQAMNVIRAQIKSITEVDEEGEGSVLTGNYGIDIISQRLKNITAEMGLGFIPWNEDTLTGDKYCALSTLGIMTDAEEASTTYGMLTIDYETLYDALDSDPDAVAALFSAEPTGVSQSPDFTALSIIEGTTAAGLYDVSVVSDGTQITSATINGEPASISGWQITGMSGDALGMAIRLDNTAAGTYDGQVAVQVGKTTEIIEELEALTKPFNEFTFEGGPLAVLQNNYKDIMRSIDSKIDFENERIKKMEANLRLKFSRLDALLGQYDLRQGQLAAALDQLE